MFKAVLSIGYGGILAYTSVLKFVSELVPKKKQQPRQRDGQIDTKKTTTKLSKNSRPSKSKQLRSNANASDKKTLTTMAQRDSTDKRAAQDWPNQKTKLPTYPRHSNYASEVEPNKQSLPSKPYFVEVDEEHDGQRLDNFLITHLKGVPKAHVYRIIRKGEIRINKGRVKQTTRLKQGDSIRIPPIRLRDTNVAELDGSKYAFLNFHAALHTPHYASSF